MRDQNAAFRYLIGALTGGDRPDAVGKKFSPDGTPIACPGFTTICHIDPKSNAFSALVEAQNRLKDGPLATAFTFLPRDSLHMTVFEGVIDYARTPERWPKHLPTDAPVAQVTDDAQLRLERIDLATRFAVRPIEIFAGFSVGVTGATPEVEALLRQTRNHLRDATNIHRTDHDTYQFHITLAYLLRWLSPEEAKQVIDLSAMIAGDLIANAPEIVLGPVELCRFETMHRFESLMTLEG